MSPRRLQTGLWALLILLSTPLAAEVYRWQDAQGRWHFSDTPPAQGGAEKLELKGAAAPTGASSSGSASSTTDNEATDRPDDRDLARQLESRFGQPEGITRHSLAVVAIETALGQGSGFFVSRFGHIVTNRHVVRPDSMPQWQDLQTRLQEAEANLAQTREALDAEQRYLASLEADLETLQRFIAGEPAGSSRRREAERERERLAGIHARRKARYNEVASEYRTEKSRFDAQRDELKFQGAVAGVAQSFKIYLKDDTRLQARLVSLSDTWDLALLQLEGYTTPVLPLASGTGAVQGARVYAIGSPLGIRDSVTSGIVTRLDRDYLFTDAQILPGNSGGPLLNEEGVVLGVNTLKVAQQSALAPGFGAAIPVDRVREAFSRWLPE